MSKYIVQSKSPNGKLVKTEVEAQSAEKARETVRRQGLAPINVRMSVNKTSKRFKIKPIELQVFTRQFSVMINSGIPIIRCLEALKSGAKNENLVGVINSLVLSIQKGVTLADSLRLHPGVFDNIYVSLVGAGEESGDLSNSLNGLSDYLERSMAIRRKVKSAMYYPVAILIVVTLVVSGLMIFIVPKFASIFASAGADLPVLTQIVVSISDWLRDQWIIVVVFVVASFFGFKYYYQTNNGRMLVDQLVLKLPIFGELIKRSTLARCSRTLARLLSAGVRVLRSVEIASSTCGNVVFERIFSKSMLDVGRGQTFADSLKKSKHIPVMMIQMIAVGEETGNIGGMLNKVADFYDEEVEATIDGLTSLIEPILMVVLGGVVGFIVLAMYLPIFNLGSVAGG